MCLKNAIFKFQLRVVVISYNRIIVDKNLTINCPWDSLDVFFWVSNRKINIPYHNF